MMLLELAVFLAGFITKSGNNISALMMLPSLGIKHLQENYKTQRLTRTLFFDPERQMFFSIMSPCDSSLRVFYSRFPQQLK